MSLIFLFDLIYPCVYNAVLCIYSSECYKILKVNYTAICRLIGMSYGFIVFVHSMSIDMPVSMAMLQILWEKSVTVDVNDA